MQDSIYHMILKSHFCIKTSRFRLQETRRFYGRQRIYNVEVICISNPLVEYRFNALLYYTLRRDVI